MTADERKGSGLRRPCSGPDPFASGWLALDDDELLYRIEALPPWHEQDHALMEVVRSDRHFFVRQEAAKKIGDAELLKACAGDRHIGQVLVRVMKRAEDIEYLEHLRDLSSHLEVRKAAEAQLDIIRASREPQQRRQRD